MVRQESRSMNQASSCPVFVDGQHICEATSASYSVERETRHVGAGHPGRVGRVEADPPMYEASFELPAETRLSIDHESRVEVAFPPDLHGGTGWRVLEVWEIYEYEQTVDRVEIGAYNGDIHTGVEYLGDDTKVATEKRGLIESPDSGIAIDITNADDESPDSDEDFEVDVHDI